MAVVNNFGTVQSTIGQLLNSSTEQFWVNAEKVTEGSGSLYRYDGEAPFTYHLPDTDQGDCLTYSGDQMGLLRTMVNA